MDEERDLNVIKNHCLKCIKAQKNFFTGSNQSILTQYQAISGCIGYFSPAVTAALYPQSGNTES